MAKLIAVESAQSPKPFKGLDAAVLPDQLGQ